MSIVRCECDAYIDSDFDAECFITLSDGTEIIECEGCRERRLAALDHPLERPISSQPIDKIPF